MLKKVRFLPTGLAMTLLAICYGNVFAQDASGTIHRNTLKQYCVTCHNQTLKTAGLMLDHLDPADLGRDANQWEKVLRKLRGREMPPAGMPRPDEATYDNFVAYIENGLDQLAESSPNPGRPAMHRLNRTEYANVIRDLLALEIDSNALLPADDSGYGFDNIGDVLTVSPFLLERYLSTAAKVSRLAIGDTTQSPSFQIYTVPRTLKQVDRMNEDLPFGSRGGTVIRHHFPVDAEYTFKVKLQTGRSGQALGLDRERTVDILIDNEILKRFTIEAGDPEAEVIPEGDIASGAEETPIDAHLEVTVPVKAGTRTVQATLLKDTTKPVGILIEYSAPGEDNESIFFEGIGSVTIGGPYNIKGSGESPSRDKIFSCTPGKTEKSEKNCARKILANLARNAYRRPVTNEDLTPLLDLYQMGTADGGFESGIRLALQRILVSPEFLFRLQIDPAKVKPGEDYRISDLDLASRVSFFLWSSIPDEELLSLAEKNRLSKPGVLEKQVQRMLADPRSTSLMTNFTGQWLYLRNMARVSPDPMAFPNFDENLRDALQKETALVFESMLRENRSVVDILDFDYTYVNERLARHYGIEGVYGAEFRRIPVTDDRRKGLLGQGSILTVTSYPDRTAPTIRGKWIMEQILGTPPPPPPPNIPSLVNDNDTKAMTMRQRMEEHRANPACAACHKVMDPLGFALENFDGLGRWRDKNTYSDTPIDSSGVLPDGTSFDGPVGLREVLLGKKDLFVETLTEKLLTYALGRGVEHYDLPVIRKIRSDAEKENYTWYSIIMGIVNSTPFQMRRAANDDIQ